MRRNYRKLLSLAVIMALISYTFNFSSVSAATPAYKVIGYVYGTPANIDAAKLTHINYAFASIVNGQLSVANPNDLTALVGLKSKNSNLKIILSIGGWGAEGFSDAALTDASRTTFANSCLQFINTYKLDGVDLDWEYPVNGGWGMIKCRPEDKQNFTLLLKKIRDTIGTGKILTIASGASQEYANNTELSQIASICDYINIMTYDFGAATHNANLYNTSTHSSGICCDTAVSIHIQNGVPASKINMGVPFYGRYGSAWPTYAQLKSSYINMDGWVRNWDNEAKACYLTKNGEFITYDDVETLGYKTAYIKQKGLGGVMFWQYNQDSNGELLNKLWTDLNDNSVQTVATPTFSPAGGTYSSAQNVTISCATSGATIRYTTDGTNPTSTSTIYSAPINVASTKTIKAKAFKSGMTDSAEASSTYTISSVSQVATPAFSPAGGTYISAQTVTISCATAGATIRYTTDGSTPTSASTQYTGPISVSSTKTVKAIAIASGMANSSVASATYTISSSGYSQWAPNTYYSAGSIVSYGGANYKCIQAHTSLTGWEPPNVPALWQPV